MVPALPVFRRAENNPLRSQPGSASNKLPTNYGPRAIPPVCFWTTRELRMVFTFLKSWKKKKKKVRKRNETRIIFRDT